MFNPHNPQTASQPTLSGELPRLIAEAASVDHLADATARLQPTGDTAPPPWNKKSIARLTP